MVELSIIIPVFHGETTLQKLYDNLVQVLQQCKLSYEIIFVDDSSTDNSFHIIQEICQKDKAVIGLLMNKNYGQHNAIYCGFEHSNGKYIITMDDDLQHPVDEIPNIIEHLEKGYDVVYAIPKAHKHNIIRNFASKFTKFLLTKMMQNKEAKNINSFRIFKSKLFDNFKNLNNPNINIDALLFWTTDNFGSIKVNHKVREQGKSGYTFFKLFVHTVNLVTSFSSLPLKITSLIGIVFSLIGFILLVSNLFSFILYGSIVRGFFFISSIIFIFSGIQLITLGVLGEYISLIHSKTLSKPAYILSRKINKD